MCVYAQTVTVSLAVSSLLAAPRVSALYVAERHRDYFDAEPPIHAASAYPYALCLYDISGQCHFVCGGW